MDITELFNSSIEYNKREFIKKYTVKAFGNNITINKHINRECIVFGVSIGRGKYKHRYPLEIHFLFWYMGIGKK